MVRGGSPNATSCRRATTPCWVATRAATARSTPTTPISPISPGRERASRHIETATTISPPAPPRGRGYRGADSRVAPPPDNRVGTPARAWRPPPDDGVPVAFAPQWTHDRRRLCRHRHHLRACDRHHRAVEGELVLH